MKIKRKESLKKTGIYSENVRATSGNIAVVQCTRDYALVGPSGAVWNGSDQNESGLKLMIYI